MKKILLFCLLGIALLAWKDSKKEAMLANIKTSEKNLLKDISKIDVEATRKVIADYDAFVAAYPKDTSSAQLLFKAGDLSRGIGEYGKAIKYWGDMREFFPTYRLTPDAMFLQAFTYEENLRDKDNAKRYYEMFLSKFPKHPFAEVAKQALQVIDIPTEQLIENFEKQPKIVVD
jgi:tetratricopeptide (TPR) repeat protein